MDAQEFIEDFLDGVKVSAETAGEGACACFVQNVASYLIDYGMLPDVTPCYFPGDYKRKKFRIDGYAFDDVDQTMNLIVADYDGIERERTLTLTDAKQAVSRALVCVDAVLNSNLSEDVDISSDASDFIDIIRSNKSAISRYRVFLLTDARMSDRIKSLDEFPFENIPVEAQIWDLNRLFEVCSSPETENIEIDFKDYAEHGIPCIIANVGDSQKYRSYLGVIPGGLLADIYDKYGARLLEGNVRSFLSTKVAVNKKIRETIINSPQMFFAFNNGISVTADEVLLETFNGTKYIVGAKDFQIINGGQTTASLYNARKKNHADLSSVYVQMKLTEIDDSQVTKDEADDLVRMISRSSNSQNKVSDADFFASHPFHRQIEQISKSRDALAPAVHGAQYQTRWFYERTRGQYIQEQLRLTPSKRKEFLLKNPKKQLIKKIDLARVNNTWLGHPDEVSKGSQTNFMLFAKYIEKQWETNGDQFNGLYYKSTAALMIMFDYLKSYIPKDRGYRANVITYSVALFHRLILKQYPGQDLNFMMIWEKQELPDPVRKALAMISEEVFNKITDSDRPVDNVTQWCKRKDCWDTVQTLRINLPEELKDCLISNEDSRHEGRVAARDQKISDGINAQTVVVKLPAEHWKRLSEFAMEHKLVTSADAAALKTACQLPFKIPNAVQARRLLELESKAREEGFQS